MGAVLAILIGVVTCRTHRAEKVFDWVDDTGELSEGLKKSRRSDAQCPPASPRRPLRPAFRTTAALKSCDGEALYQCIGIRPVR